MKKLRFERAELVTANYYCNFEAEDLPDFIEYLENCCGKEAYEHLKDLTFDDWCAIANGEREDVSWDTKNGLGDWTYVEHGEDYLCNYLREVALDNDDVFYDYNDMYDDSWEELSVEE